MKTFKSLSNISMPSRLNSFLNLIVFSLITVSTSTSHANPKKDIDASNYRDSCIKNQMQMHNKLKKKPAESFHSYCECTSKFLFNNLSSAELSELNTLSKSDKKPSWFSSKEDLAIQKCLSPSPKIQV